MQSAEPSHNGNIAPSPILARNVAAVAQLEAADRARQSSAEHFSDSIARVAGTPWFAWLHVAWYAAWVAWNAGFVKALGVVLIGNTGEVDERGKPMSGDSLMLLLNAHWEPIEFQFPRLIGIVTDFERLFDTFVPTAPTSPVNLNHSYRMHPRTTALFRWTPRVQVE